MSKKQMLSKIKLGGILAALAASVGIFAAMLQVERKTLSEYERGCVYAAAREIPKGLVITEQNQQNYLKLLELEKSCIPKTALRSPEQLAGLAARHGIEEGVLLTTGMFEQPSEVMARMDKPVIAGLKAEDLYQVVGGVLRSGDRIHLYTVSAEGEAGLVWENIYVEEVFDGSGRVISGTDSTTAAQRINVYLNAKDVERFYTELAHGTLRAVKVCE